MFSFFVRRVPTLFLYNLMKCKMTPLQMEIRFSYLKLVHIFGISLNLTIVAEGLLKLKFLIPISMERSNEISSSEGEFDLTLLNEEITYIHRELDDTENNSNAGDSDEVRCVRRRKIRVINNECDSDTDTTEDSQSDNSEWISCTESEEISSRIPFIAGDTPAGPHVLPDKKEPLDFSNCFLLMNS